MSSENGPEKVLAVISVQGRDQKGVVAQFATFVAERGINIEDMEQRVVRGIFVMDMLVDLRDMTESLDGFIMGLMELGRKIGMEARIVLQRSAKTKRVALLVSKEPHCLHKLTAMFKEPEVAGEVVGVFANHPVLEAEARQAGFEFAWKTSGGGIAGGAAGAREKDEHMGWLLERLREVKADLVVLARYMQIVSPEIVKAYENRIINIHPSLLPHFPGASPYRQAFESGVRVTGCTAHFVTEELDQGPIILQDVFHINVGVDTAEDVRQKGLNLEAETLCKAVRFYLNEEVVVVGGKVVFKPGISSFAKARTT